MTLNFQDFLRSALKPTNVLRLVMLSSLLLALWCGNQTSAAQEQDVVASVKKATAELTAADKVAAAARTALLAAREGLDTTRFNSAAYNARISKEQLAAVKGKYEKAAPEAKADALEAYELAQELDAQRKTALEAAEKLLPQREAEAKEAEEKYAAVLATAETAAGQVKSVVRQSDEDAQTKLKDSKLAIEKAAFTKATAEQKAAANAAILKTMTELVEADKALQQSATAVKQAAENDRPQKLAEAEKATKAYVLGLHVAAQQLPSLEADKARAATLTGLSSSLVEADKAAQKTTAALQQAKQDAQDKAKVVKQTEERIKAAHEGMEKRIARIRAQKDIEREQEALKRAQAAVAEAEQALPAKTAEMEKAQQAYAAAVQAAVQALVLAPEPEQALMASKAAIAKAIADRESEIKKENEALTREATEAEKVANRARAELAAADKAVAERTAARESLLKIMRQRFYREIRLTNDDLKRHEKALADASKELQTKTTAQNKAGDALKLANENLSKAQKNADAQAVLVTNASKDQQAAAKPAQEKAAAKAAAEQNVREAQIAVSAAKDALASAAAEDKAAAEKQAKEKEAAVRVAAEKVKEAQQAANASQAVLDKAVAALKAAEKRAGDAANAARDAGQKVASAQAALDKVTSERNAAEGVVNQHRKNVETASAQLAAARMAFQGGLKPLAISAWDLAKARHLLVRAGFGGTPEEVAKLHALGLHGAVSYLVDFQKQPPAEVAFAAYPKEQPGNYESVLHSDDQRRLREQRVARDRRQLQDMRAWWLRRMIESPRPLEEKLTLFWHGQVPVQYSTVGDSYYMYLQNQLYRDNAAGNFATLLHGIAHDAAMLKYLNNDTNVKGRANENLAREIIELFSMGRDQGYTEIDIRQGARALTGYTYDPATGQFRFISDRHDTEPKTIFGKTGNWSGDDYVRLILDTPYPAKFITRQLFTYFVHNEPSLDTIESMAGILRLNNYDLKLMLENLFLSEEFYSPKAMSTDVKCPVQLIVGLHRDLGLKNPDYAYLATAVRDMGQDLFEPPSVFGWQADRSWITTSRILGRYNVLAEVLEKRPRAGKAGVDVVGTVLAGKTFKSHTEVVDYLVKCSWTVPLSESKRQALVEFLKPLPEPAQWAANPGPVNARLTRLLVMLMCAPEYQLSWTVPFHPETQQTNTNLVGGFRS